MPQTLLELAVESLQENFDRYDREQLRRILVPFATIKEKIRESFLRKSHEHCSTGSKCNDRLYAALPLWMKYCHSKTLLVDELPNCHNSRLSNLIFQEVVRYLPLKTPNVTEISFFGLNECNLSIGVNEIDAIVKLARLTHLEIHKLSIPLSGFLKIVELCENLEYVCANISDIDVEVQSSLIWKCFANNVCDLIKGKLVLCLSKKLTMEEQLLEEDEYRILMNLPHYGRLDLQPLSIAELKDLLKIHMHTQITLLNMNCDELKDGDTLDQFPHFPHVIYANFELKSMVPDASSRARVEDGNYNVLRSFLRCNGQSLLHLKISNLASGQLSLEQLFDWCPNLKTLFLVNCSITSGNNVPIEHFGKLEQVIWQGENIDGTVPLAIILSAPLLETFDFNICTSCIFDFGDSDSLICSIAQRKILQNLEFFRFGNMHYFREECNNEAIFYKNLISVVQTLCSHQNVSVTEEIF